MNLSRFSRIYIMNVERRETANRMQLKSQRIGLSQVQWARDQFRACNVNVYFASTKVINWFRIEIVHRKWLLASGPQTIFDSKWTPITIQSVKEFRATRFFCWFIGIHSIDAYSEWLKLELLEFNVLLVRTLDQIFDPLN